MAEATTRGTCEACGKTFRIPSASRTYRCKACGGSVRPNSLANARFDADDAEPREPAPRSAGDARAVRRRSASRKAKYAWVLLALLLVLGTGAYGLLRTAPAVLATGAQRDLDLATIDLARAWDARDLEWMEGVFHPDRRAALRQRLLRVAENRGWKAAFPAIDTKMSRHTKGDRDHPEQANAMLMFRPATGYVSFDLQFEPSRDCWYVTDMTLPRPPLSPFVNAFSQAWSKSSPEALHPCFTASGAEKMANLVSKTARESGWQGGYPVLGQPRSTPDEVAQQPLSDLLGGSTESVFPTEQGELLVRWRYQPDEDRWYVSGFRFPKGE